MSGIAVTSALGGLLHHFPGLRLTNHSYFRSFQAKHQPERYDGVDVCVQEIVES